MTLIQCYLCGVSKKEKVGVEWGVAGRGEENELTEEEIQALSARCSDSLGCFSSKTTC